MEVGLQRNFQQMIHKHNENEHELKLKMCF